MGEFMLPAPGNYGAPRRRGGDAPNVGDVQQVRPTSDPGLRVPDLGSVGTGLEKAGDMIEHGALTIGRALERQQLTYEAIQTGQAELEYKKNNAAEFQRWQANEDTSDPESVKKFTDWQKTELDRITAALPEKVSDRARERLGLSLQSQAVAYSTEAGKLQFTSAQQKSLDLIQTGTNLFSAQAARNPGALETILQQGDEDIANFSGTLNPNAERDAKSRRRKSIIEGTINGMVDGGGYDEAATIVKGGKYDADLDEKTRERISNNIDRGQRMAIARAEHVANVAERDLKRAQSANEATLMVGMDSGKDVPDSVLRSAVMNRQITDAGYRMLVERKVKGAEGTDNPSVLIDLQTKMVRDGEDIHDLIIDRRNSKQLSSTTTGKLIEENQRRQKSELKEDFKSAEEKNAFGYMSKYLGGDKLAFNWDDDTARRVATAQKEFRERIATDKESAQTIADDIVLKYAKNDPLPPVGYIGSISTDTLDGVKQAGEKLRGLRDAGRITPDSYDREMGVLKQYHDRAPPPAPPKPGAKK